MKKSAAVIVALFASACTNSLAVRQVSSTEARTRVGLPYAIPMTQYEVALEYNLTECGSDPEISVSAKVVETRGAPDPEHRYTIDPNSLSSLVKTSDVKLEYYPNGMVKSLNVTAEDKTGEIITNIGSIAVKIAKFGAGAGARTTPATNKKDGCTGSAAVALEAVKKLKPLIDMASTRVEASLENLKNIREKIATLGINADAASQTALSNAYDALQTDVDEQKSLLKKLAKAKKPISYTETLFWPSKGSEPTYKYAYPKAVIESWASLDDDPKKRAALDVYFSVESVTPFLDPNLTVGSARSLPKVGGIPFRQPEQGWLKICAGALCGAKDADALFDQKGSVHQLGLIYYLPCKSRPFTSISCTLEITEGGWLKQIGSGQKEAALVGATKAIDGLLGNATDIKGALKTDQLAEIKAKTDLIKAENDYRAALKAQEENPNAPVSSQTLAINAQVDLAKARLALLEAEEALSKKQGGQ